MDLGIDIDTHIYMFAWCFKSFQWAPKVFPNIFPITTIRNNIGNSEPTMVSTHMGPIWASIQHSGQPKEHQHILV